MELTDGHLRDSEKRIIAQGAQRSRVRYLAWLKWITKVENPKYRCKEVIDRYGSQGITKQQLKVFMNCSVERLESILFVLEDDNIVHKAERKGDFYYLLKKNLGKPHSKISEIVT